MCVHRFRHRFVYWTVSNTLGVLHRSSIPRLFFGMFFSFSFFFYSPKKNMGQMNEQEMR